MYGDWRASPPSAVRESLLSGAICQQQMALCEFITKVLLTLSYPNTKDSKLNFTKNLSPNKVMLSKVSVF